jgi:hypothetical protein
MINDKLRPLSTFYYLPIYKLRPLSTYLTIQWRSTVQEQRGFYLELLQRFNIALP